MRYIILDPDGNYIQDCYYESEDQVKNEFENYTTVEPPQPCFEPRCAWEDITQEEWLAKQPVLGVEKSEMEILQEKLGLMQQAIDDLILGGG
ncbi:hypothetical protein [Weizmannia sp. CD-2023]|uniref:hypothetical protein n=1 Tax=Weizmannia sp. CD-2023 TaxID=3037263 RepID=UPI002E1D21AD|nr:hypothetical protein [Weizmannia sp. CD-2023]